MNRPPRHIPPSSLKTGTISIVSSGSIGRLMALLFLVFGHVPAIFSQEIIDGYIVHNYTMQDGLPNNQVLYSMQDSKGYMWFATGGGGVSRFDGTEFKTYDISDGLTDSDVFTIHEDHKGRLWFGTFNCQLAYLENDSIYSYEYNETIRACVAPESLIYRMHMTEEGSLFLFFSNHIMVEIDSAGNCIKSDRGEYRAVFDLNSFGLDGQSYLSSDKKSVLGDSSGWSSMAFNFYKGSSVLKKQIKDDDFFANNPILSRCHLTFIDGRSFFFIGTQPYLLDTVGDLDLKRISINDWILDHNHINTFLDDDMIWILLENFGIVRGKVEGNSFRIEDHIFQGEFITYVHEDRDGGFWLGTIDRGVLYIPDPMTRSIRKETGWQVFPKCLDVLTDTELVYAIGPNTVVLEQRNRIDTLALEPRFSYCTATLFSQDSKELIVLFKYGLMVYDLSHGKPALLPSPTLDTRGVGGNDIYFDSDDSTYRMVSSELQGYDPSLNHVNNMLEFDLRGWSLTGLGSRTLIGSNIGLHEFLESSDGWTQIEAASDHPIYHSYIVDFENYREGTWIATTGRGVAFFKDSVEFTIGLAEGLSSLKINGLKQDEDTLWVSTSKGLNKVILDDSGRVDEIFVFTRSSGMSSDQSTGVEVSDRYIYISNSKSIDRIARNDLSGKDSKVDMLDLQLIDLTEGIVLQEQDIDLGYDHNHLAFNVKDIDFSSLGEQEFRYRLQPFDMRWKKTSLREIEYHDLVPADYRFEIQKKTRSGQWASSRSIAFQIFPPIWERWWFRLFLLMFLTALIIWRIRKREKNLTKEMELRNQMHNLREKALRAQVNPHFLFNTLNSIQKFILKGDVEASNLYLSRFSNLIRRILDRSEHEYISLKEEIEMLRLYLDLERMRSDWRFDYRMFVDPTFDPGRTKVPSMLIQPYVENAIWHGLAQDAREGLIEIEFYPDADGDLDIIHCIVTDNGIGRNASAKLKTTDSSTRKARGMGLTEQRLRILNEKSGTHIHVEDLYDGDNQAIGTRIQLSMPIRLNDQFD